MNLQSGASMLLPGDGVGFPREVPLRRRRFLRVAGGGRGGGARPDREGTGATPAENRRPTSTRGSSAPTTRGSPRCSSGRRRRRRTRGGAPSATSTASTPRAARPRASSRRSSPRSPPPGPASAARRSLAERLPLAARALLALQHADGTIDLPTTNFHSPPDTAFVLEPVCASLAVIRTDAAARARRGGRDLERFARAAGEALARGRDPHAEPPLGRLRGPRPPARALPRLAGTSRGSTSGWPRGSTSTRTASSPSGARPSTRRPATGRSSPWPASSTARRSASPCGATWR